MREWGGNYLAFSSLLQQVEETFHGNVNIDMDL